MRSRKCPLGLPGIYPCEGRASENRVRQIFTISCSGALYLDRFVSVKMVYCVSAFYKKISRHVHSLLSYRIFLLFENS